VTIEPAVSGGAGAVAPGLRRGDQAAPARGRARRPGHPHDFAPGVWDTWNAKNPLAQRDEALAADAGLLARLQTVAPQERDRFTFAMGPMSFGFDQFVGPRLKEHAFHTWDVEVVPGSRSRRPRPGSRSPRMSTGGGGPPWSKPMQ